MESKDNESPIEAAFAPYRASIERFAKHKGLNVGLEESSHDPSIRLTWVNAAGRLCTLDFYVDTEHHISLVGLCWGSSDLLGRRTWAADDDPHLSTRTELLLQQGYTWAEALS